VSPGGIAAHFPFVSMQRSICRVGLGLYETSTFDNYIPKINECRMKKSASFRNCDRSRRISGREVAASLALKLSAPSPFVS
jgi:hypothetical protein